MTAQNLSKLLLALTFLMPLSSTRGLAWAGNLFSGPINSPAGHYPWALAAGDFNGDGSVDLAVTNNISTDSKRRQVKVLLGDGTGVFGKPVGYGVGNEPMSVAVGDFNGDGKLDLVVVNHREPTGSGKLSVLLGNGDGTFQPELKCKAGPAPVYVAIGDFNGDGKEDLAVTVNGSPGFVSILLGNGDGTFQSPIKIRGTHHPFYIAVGDLNGDGKLDLVMVGNSNRFATTVLLGNGDGTFRMGWTQDAKVLPTGFALGDFNGDGKLDLAEIFAFVDRLTIRLGNGDGTFQEGRHYAVGEGPTAIAVADFDNDGQLDVAVASGTSANVSVLLGLGNGKFQQASYYLLNPRADPRQMIATDVNGDGKPDLVVTDHSNGVVSVLLNTGGKK